MIEIKENEVLLRDQNQWLYFGNPHKIMFAEKLEDVIPVLQEVECLVDTNNWHAAGFLSFESASAFDSALLTHASTTLLREHSSLRSARGAEFPYLWFGLYSQPSQVYLPNPQGPRELLNWQPTIDDNSYHAAIAEIKEYIADGETYQVNYTMRLQADFNKNPWDFFLHLIQNQNTHAAYIDLGQYVICSASPELFFQLDEETIACRPMKGTAKRGRTTIEDGQQADWLTNSIKNRAENVMIVDMIRNDLGRIAKAGSVQVTELFRVERYPTLWQMTSTVTARTNASIVEIFRALFPCASITGAPKVSTLKIINELETEARKIYTGSIGYISPQRKARFNVAIRTVLFDRDYRRAEYGVGGGIVWDSNSAEEYAEALLKAQILNQPQPEFSLLETMLWTSEDGYYLYKKHMDRLLDSANYFDFSVSKEMIEQRLKEIGSSFVAPHRVRLLVSKNGELKTASTLFHSKEISIHAHLAKKPISSDDILLFHKTTLRDIYDMAHGHYPNCDDVLLYNERGELTEFTIGNLVLELHGQLVTPPVECGLLAGTFRAYLLETGQVMEKIVSVDQLKDCTKIFRVNSVRRWEAVQME